MGSTGSPACPPGPPQLLARPDARARRYGLWRAEQLRRAVADQVRDGR